MLPKIKLPYYEIKIPDDNSIIHIKPYTIEIEKSLVSLDKENMNIIEQTKIIKELLNFCIVEDYNLDNLSIGTIQWLFLKCYEISVSERIEFQNIHKCDDKKTDKVNITIYIKDIKYDYDKNTIRIPIDTEDGKYFLEYGNIKVKSLEYLNNEDDSLHLISSCLERMYDENGNNEIELTFEDKIEVTKTLPISELSKIGDFIQKINRPYFNLEYDCPTCGKHIKEKLVDFFI